MDMFIPGQIYRRRDLHDQYGGQQRYGISTPSNYPLILLFTTQRGKAFYHDGWTTDGIYLYSGEGQRGDMTFTRGNLALRDHYHDQKDIHLFTRVTTGQYRYIDQMICTGYTLQRGPDTEGNQRDIIIFELVPLRQFITNQPTLPTSTILQPRSLTQLRQQLLTNPPTANTPQTRVVQTQQRSEDVKDYARRRANGRCEACENPAPFTTANDEPYLEVHHIHRLTDGGPDQIQNVAALCPNCHRRAHYANDHETFNDQLATIIAQKEAQLTP